MKEEYIYEWIYKRRNSKRIDAISFVLPRDFPKDKLVNGDYVVKLYKLEREK